MDKVPWNEKGYNCFTDCRSYTDDFCLIHTRFIEGQVVGVNEPTLTMCPLYSKGDVWHCVFCGRHGSALDFVVKVSASRTIQGCPSCREYKGLEKCDPDTCECWTFDVVRKLAENMPDLSHLPKLSPLLEEIERKETEGGGI